MDKKNYPKGLKPISNTQWEYRTKNILIEFSIINGLFGFYEGPINTTARMHEGGGGTFKLNDVPTDLFKKEHPDLRQFVLNLIKEKKQQL